MGLAAVAAQNRGAAWPELASPGRRNVIPSPAVWRNKIMTRSGKIREKSHTAQPCCCSSVGSSLSRYIKFLPRIDGAYDA